MDAPVFAPDESVLVPVRTGLAPEKPGRGTSGSPIGLVGPLAPTVSESSAPSPECTAFVHCAVPFGFNFFLLFVCCFLLYVVRVMLYHIMTKLCEHEFESSCYMF